MRTHIRLQKLEIKDWNGKGPGKRGKWGHIYRMEVECEEAKIANILIDDISKEKSWLKHYEVVPPSDGSDIEDGLRLYTDGSKQNGNSGYGAVLMRDDDICDETYGSQGQSATVFQAECQAIVRGLDLVTSTNENLTILTDNQAVVLALLSPTTTSNTVKELKEALENKSTHRVGKIQIRWIRAHVGHNGYEYADKLAKQGTETLIYGPFPTVMQSKPLIHAQINDYITQIWQERWNARTDARQTAIFFPVINKGKSRELTNCQNTH